MPIGDNQPGARTVIGPKVTVALPFSKITNADADAEAREAVAELATLVARLAAQAEGGDASELRSVHDAAEQLATRLSTHDR
jgi:hypothetical protein